MVTIPKQIEKGRANVPVRIRRRIVQIQRIDTINQVIVAITETNGYRRDGASPSPCCEIEY